MNRLCVDIRTLITQHNVFILARDSKSKLVCFPLSLQILKVHQHSQFCPRSISLFLFVSDFFGHYGSLRLCLGCLVCTLCGPIIIKTLAADMTFCWKKDIKVRAVLRHYNDIGHPLGLSRVHCTGPIWSWTDNYDTIWRRGKMLLLVLQPLILYCVNNKLLAIKLNRLRVMFLKSPELYLNMTKNTTLMCSCWSLIVDLSRFISP